MDCRTADLLIEAFHDDELEVAQVAGLLAHVDSCFPCSQRHESVRALRELCRNERPADRCPDELKRRLATCLPVPQGVRWPRVALRTFTIVLVATGIGFAVGRRVPAGTAPSDPSKETAPPLSRAPVALEGDVLCLQCSMKKLFPGPTAGRSENHSPILRMPDGRYFLLVDQRGKTAASPVLLGNGCGERHVHLTARLDQTRGIADVVSDSPDAAAPGTPAGERLRSAFVRNSKGTSSAR